MKKIAFTVMASLLIAATASASVITATSTDRTYRSTGGTLGAITDATLLAGTQAANVSAGFVIPFLIPSLGGASITDVQLSLTAVANTISDTGTSIYLEIYGIRSSSGATTLATDYTGTTTPLVSNWIQMNASAATGTYTANSAALTSWINSNAVEGEYLFLTFKPSGALAANTYKYLSFASVDSGANMPALTITTVIPEPATIGMLGIGALFALLLRRLKS